MYAVVLNQWFVLDYTNKKHWCLNVQYSSYAVTLETKKTFMVSERHLEELVAHLAKHDPMVKSWTLCPA
jgi:hypothetical protein